MADVKQKPKMDKPKVKDVSGSFPKDVAMMLKKEYQQAAEERGGDVRRRPEQEAVEQVEDGMRTAADRGLSAAKRGAKKLAGRGESGSGTETNRAPVQRKTAQGRSRQNAAHRPKAASFEAVGNRDYTGWGATQSKEKMQKNARRNVVKEKVIQNQLSEKYSLQNLAGGTGHRGDGKTAPVSGVKTKQADSLKNRGTLSVGSKTKATKQGLRLKTRKTHMTRAQAAVKKAKQTKQRVEMVVKAAKKAAMATARGIKKVAMMIAKAAAATVKALLAAVGPIGIVVLIFIVVAAIAAVLASPFGLFVSGEDEDAKARMQQTVAAISHDYRENIHDIIGANIHDEMRFEFINHGYQRTDNWIDVLAVFAVKTANFDDGMDVVEITDEHIQKLREVFWDMQDISYEVKNEPIYNSEDDTYTDHYVLYIRAECLGAWTMASRYGFSRDQREVLVEMLSGEYDSYFVEMIGSASLFAAIGDGGGVVGTGNFIWPSAASNYVTSPHGSRIHPITGQRETHLGIDIGAGAGTGVLAADGGTVTRNNIDSSYGIHLLIDHGNGYQTLYAHMSAAHVGVGDTVEQGQVIGLVGSTGTSTNPHLHFEVRVNGNHVDPLQFFDNYTTAW